MEIHGSGSFNLFDSLNWVEGMGDEGMVVMLGDGAELHTAFGNDQSEEVRVGLGRHVFHALCFDGEGFGCPFDSVGLHGEASDVEGDFYELGSLGPGLKLLDDGSDLPGEEVALTAVAEDGASSSEQGLGFGFTHCAGGM